MRLSRTPNALLLTLALTAGALAQQKKPVTLESLGGSMARMMGGAGGAPVWSPKGQRFVYRKADKVLLYELASGAEKELFAINELTKLARPGTPETAMGWENRRVREETLQWSADGRRILIITGGDLFLWSEETGKVEQLTASEEPERDAKLSPDASKVSFRRGVELYVLEVAAKSVRRLTHDGSATRWNAKLDWVYPEELDLGTAHWWSPDSKSIAYMQFEIGAEHLYPQADHLPVVAVAEPERYPKAGTPNADVRVGVVAAAGGPTRWMDYGETRGYLLARVHWTPDSADVLVHRLNRVQNHLQIMAAEAASGRSRIVIDETDKDWININDDFVQLSDGRIVRTAEKDGFRHIYLHGKNGKELKRLSAGPWQVDALACVDEKAGLVYYSSSELSPVERQFYVINLMGKGKRQISSGAGTHSVSMSPACDAYLDNYSSLEQPSEGTLRNAGGKSLKVWREADRKSAEEYDLLKTEIHPFKGADGTLFYGRLIRPAGFDAAKKYPVIVNVYGGPHAQSVRNAWSGLSWDQVMAHKGFVIWQMDNRGSFGRGHAFEAAVSRRLGTQEVADQKEGIAYLKSLGFIDPARVGITGWSYGGYMTLQALLHAPEVFKAGVAGAAVTDWRNYDTIYTERYMGLPEENVEGYKTAAPVNAAANLQGRLLLLHNIEDDNVLFANCMQMMNALQQAGKPYQFLLYPQKSHGVTGKARTHMVEQQTRFFEEALK